MFAKKGDKPKFELVKPKDKPNVQKKTQQAGKKNSS